MRVLFAKIERGAEKRGTCPVCGKRVLRRTTFQQTLNPYNVNAQGEPKSRQEIHAELKERAEQWTPDFRHEACRTED